MRYVWLIAAIFLGMTTMSAYEYELPFILVGCGFCAYKAARGFMNGNETNVKGRDGTSMKEDDDHLQKAENPKLEPKPEPAKPAGKLCRHCGSKVGPDDIYCIECGNRVQQ